MNGTSSLPWFFARATFWFLLLVFAWLQVSARTSIPVAGIAHVALEYGAKDWVRKVGKSPGRLEVETRVQVTVPGQGTAELIVEADPARFAYGLPLFLALLLASRSRHLVRRALAGYVLLLFPQAFSLLFEVLKQIMAAGGNPLSLGIAAWQMEAIALSYQFGTLLLPTLAPVALWLWLEGDHVARTLGKGWWITSH